MLTLSQYSLDRRRTYEAMGSGVRTQGLSLGGVITQVRPGRPPGNTALSCLALHAFGGAGGPFWLAAGAHGCEKRHTCPLTATSLLITLPAIMSSAQVLGPEDGVPRC